jgi:hypothetical protein
VFIGVASVCVKCVKPGGTFLTGGGGNYEM